MTELEQVIATIKAETRDEPWFSGEFDGPMISKDLMDATALILNAVATDQLVPAQAWMPIESAPKDGRILCLLVDYKNGGSPLDDAAIAATIGFNCFENTGDDAWQIAGWDWEQDCFSEGAGEVIGWTEFAPPLPPPPAEGV